VRHRLVAEFTDTGRPVAIVGTGIGRLKHG